MRYQIKTNVQSYRRDLDPRFYPLLDARTEELTLGIETLEGILISRETCHEDGCVPQKTRTLVGRILRPLSRNDGKKIEAFSCRPLSTRIKITMRILLLLYLSVSTAFLVPVPDRLVVYHDYARWVSSDHRQLNHMPSTNNASDYGQWVSSNYPKLAHLETPSSENN